jgi:hypothetical protein
MANVYKVLESENLRMDQPRLFVVAPFEENYSIHQKERKVSSKHFLPKCKSTYLNRGSFTVRPRTEPRGKEDEDRKEERSRQIRPLFE